MDTGMVVEIAKAYLITELSDFCRVAEHLAQPRDERSKGVGPKGSRRVKRSKKGGLSEVEGRHESPRDKSFKRTRGGED